jgi:hypothetical protein
MIYLMSLQKRINYGFTRKSIKNFADLFAGLYGINLRSRFYSLATSSITAKNFCFASLLWSFLQLFAILSRMLGSSKNFLRMSQNLIGEKFFSSIKNAALALLKKAALWY